MEGEPIEQSQSEFETDFSSSPQDTGASSSGDDSDVDRRTLNTNNGSRFSTDYRHHLVTALKRRFKPGQDSQSQSNHNMQHMDDSMHSDIYDQQQQHQHGYEDTYQQDNMENHPDNLTRSHMTTRQPPTSYHHDVVHQPEQNSHSDDENHYPVDPFDGRVMTMDDSAVVNSRNTRVAQTETAIRQDMFKECTFKPVIRKLPRSYGTSATANDSFYDRVMKWQKERDALAKNRLKMHQESYKTDCTFNPQISRYSERAAAQSRAQSTKHSDSGGGGKISTNERLYKSTLLAREHKKFAEEEIKREQDEKLRQENEYRIHGAKNPKYKEIGPRVYNNLLDNNPNNSVLNQTPRGRSATPSKDPNCSFTPKVKGVSQQMTSAKLYLSANVVDRLTKPIAQQNKKSYDDNYIHNTNLRRTAMNDSEMDSRPDVMDVASFMSSLGGNLPYNTPGYKPNNNRARPQSAPRERYASDNMSIASQGSGINTVGTNASTQDKKARMEKFKQFLERQKQSQKKKTHNIQDATRATTPVFKPDLCRKSLDITESHFKGTFMERVRRDVINRKTKETNNKIEQNAKDVSCTFKPQISSKSAQLRPRSSYELSKGDLLKRESAQKLNKVRTEQEQLAAATFQPVISKYATKKQIKSKLNLTQPPGEFMEEYQRDLEKKQQTRESLLQQKNAEETKECTFKPQTTECPSYIKRIAKSMQVVRAARKLNEANKSPDQKPPSTWR